MAAPNAAIAALQPIPPPVVADVAMNQLLDDAYGNPVTSLERAHASTIRLKLADGLYLGNGAISLDEYQRTIVHSAGTQITAAADNQLLDLPALQNQALLQTIQQALAPLLQALAPLQQSMHAMEQSIIDVHNRAARTHNATGHDPTFPLETIKRYPPAFQPGVAPPAAALVLVPANFPLTLGGYFLLTHLQKRTMILFYGIPNVDANVNDIALRRHLGLHMPSI